MSSMSCMIFWVVHKVHALVPLVLVNDAAVRWTHLLPPTKEEVNAIAGVCLSVCLSLSKITQKHVDGFGWNVACRQMSEHGGSDELLSLIRIIVRIPEPKNRKINDLSKSVKLAPHSYGCGAMSRQSCPIFGFWPIFPMQN